MKKKNNIIVANGVLKFIVLILQNVVKNVAKMKMVTEKSFCQYLSMRYVTHDGVHIISLIKMIKMRMI